MYHHTWHGLDSLISSCMRSEHVAHVAPSCGPLDGFGGREGAIDPATEAHHSWLVEGGPELHLGTKVSACKHVAGVRKCWCWRVCKGRPVHLSVVVASTITFCQAGHVLCSIMAED